MSPLDDAEARLWHAWKAATDAVRARVAADIAAATDLSDPDFAVLTRVAELGGGRLRQSELAASTGWHRSRLSHHLTRMQERGLVERAGVGGGVDVVLTQAGLLAAAQARPVHAESVRRHLLAAVPAQERAALTDLLEQLANR